MAEHKVANVAELPADGAKEVTIEGTKILVGRSNGQLFAVGGTCPHYGAPLVNGSIMNGRVKCQWHGACFSTATGDIEDTPGLDSLQCYPVRAEGEDVFIKVTEEQLKTPKRRRVMAKLNQAADARVFVVIGGGAAGSAAVESIRATGFEGRLVWLMKESTLPTDRPKLSKMLNLDENSALLRPAEFFKEFDIEFHVGAEVTSLDPASKLIEYKEKGESLSLKFDEVLVATGGSPMSLRLEGAQSQNVYTLRTLADAQHLGQLAAENPAAKVVVVGSNFIGMEIAATLSKLVASVTVVARGAIPFKPFGDEIGTSLLRLFEKNNVVFRPNAEPKELKVKDGKVFAVVCADGAELPCDFVVCGVGVEIKSSTAFIKRSESSNADAKSQIQINAQGAIQVDAHLSSGVAGVWAAGDIVVYPDPLFGSVRIEHWGVAGSMGKAAGRNMVLASKGAEHLIPYSTVPFFWTLNFGKGVRYVGHAASWDEIIFDKEENGLEVDTLKFVAYYVKNNTVVAVATVARDPMATRCAEFMKWGKMPSPDTIKAAIQERGSTNHLFFQ
jgi:NADPH-dependent 2,4-dienoyl-CoA reductase/sulfur reductase-like enzyme/nitrite reductase/ring-hydroxylating ferredoxin subunit